MYNFLCQNVLTFQIHIIHKKKLKHLQIYILGHLFQKKQASKKCRLCKNDQIFTKIPSVKMTRYSQRSEVVKGSNTLKLYTLKALPSKNRFYRTIAGIFIQIKLFRIYPFESSICWKKFKHFYKLQKLRNLHKLFAFKYIICFNSCLRF